MTQWIRIYLIPGAVLQSVMIGGGYGTGREVVEFFTRYGVTGGLLGIAVAAVCIAVIFALSLEITRRFAAYDYRSFFQTLLGPFWFLYELLIVALFMLVIAVIGAAAGEILATEFGISRWQGGAGVLAIVVLLTFYGREFVMRVLTFWSLVLYAVFLTYLASVWTTFGDAMTSGFAQADTRPGWFVAALQYSFYNVTAIPVILYAARAIDTPRQALLSGSLGALIGILPALFLHLSFVARYPAILDAELPVYEMFTALDAPLLKLGYLIVLVGTFIETGAGNVQGFLERLDGWWEERTGDRLGRPVHALITAGVLLAALSLSGVGIIALIAEGYGTLAWGFFGVYVVPLLTIGLWRILRGQGRAGAQ
ncbi:MAG: hypothetical protein V2I63_09900 [Pseudomonadales bacterium]|jgi:uncharacterized membrane protein YkvI|nr:hypothetical protein [Pseudomonadales bacterium]